MKRRPLWPLLFVLLLCAGLGVLVFQRLQAPPAAVVAPDDSATPTREYASKDLTVLNNTGESIVTHTAAPQASGTPEAAATALHPLTDPKCLNLLGQ